MATGVDKTGTGENAADADLSRRDLLRLSGLAGLVLPTTGAAAGLASLVLSGGAARAAGTGQCVIGVTQEAVNFNPLLYVNTGVETSVEFIVFDSLWKIDDAGKFVPNLAAEIPTLIGNIVGGLAFTGLMLYSTHVRTGAPRTARLPAPAVAPAE